MKHNGFEYVDLGLPSGTKWARCNVGANSETDNGLYFAFGETKGYDSPNGAKIFDRHHYKFSNKSFLCKFTKYNNTDGKKVLDLCDDAAHIHMGGKWHMPTKEQFEELLDEKNTASTWIYDYCIREVSGRLFRSRINNETLFIPANGFISNHQYVQNGQTCSLWTSSIDFSSVYNCTDFFCDKYNTYLARTSAYYVCIGIRGVFNTFWMK